MGFEVGGRERISSQDSLLDEAVNNRCLGVSALPEVSSENSHNSLLLKNRDQWPIYALSLNRGKIYSNRRKYLQPPTRVFNLPQEELCKNVIEMNCNNPHTPEKGKQTIYTTSSNKMESHGKNSHAIKKYLITQLTIVNQHKLCCHTSETLKNNQQTTVLKPYNITIALKQPKPYITP